MWSLLSRKWQVTIIIASGFVVAWAYDAVMAYFTGMVAPTQKGISFAVFSTWEP